VFATMTANAIRSTHDLGLVPDFSGATGRVNHVAFRVDQRQDVERGAEVFMGHDTPIEFGPGIHGIDEITYLYVREPGGLRIELNAGGWENYQPDWEATEWHPRQGPTTHWRNVQMPDSMMESMPLSGEAREAMAQTDMFAGS
jgi:catechol 2,3-dioxygenase